MEASITEYVFAKFISGSPRGLPGETLDIDSLLCNLIRFNTAGMPAVTGCQRF